MKNGFFRAIKAGYDAVTNRSNGRVGVPVERTGEDGILAGRKRSQLVATQRDAFRNTTFSPATALQLQINVVGVEGGKLAVTTDDESYNAQVESAFRRWARHCDFTDGTHLNETLQLLLIQLTHNGGDFIAVFDDGILTGGHGTGRIRIFESDEIKDVEDAVFATLYGPTYKQMNGIVYDPFGRVCAAFVSSKGRNEDKFKAGEFIHLRLSTPADFERSNWIFVANRWRVNQGRGVSTATHVTNLLQDLADTQGSEVQAAKLNAGLGIVVKDTTETAESGTRDWETDEVASDTAADDAATEAAENAALKQASTNLQAGMSAIVKLGYGKDMSSFTTERPNLNTVQFIKDQRAEAGTVFGIGPTYTTLDPAGSYTSARAAIVMAEKAFARLRKKLERDFLDWLAVRVAEWNGIGTEDLADNLVWLWPTMPEIDEGSYQTAVEKMFANGVITARQLNGANWKKVADQQAAEKAYYEERGLVYPASRTSNGSVVTDAAEPVKEEPNAD